MADKLKKLGKTATARTPTDPEMQKLPKPRAKKVAPAHVVLGETDGQVDLVKAQPKKPRAPRKPKTDKVAVTETPVDKQARRACPHIARSLLGNVSPAATYRYQDAVRHLNNLSQAG
jgi:hypothetical protein